MDWLRDYLLKMICAALLCGMLTGLIGKKGALGTTVKLLTGVFMVMTIVSPWIHMRIQGLSDFFQDVSYNADAAVTDGQNTAREMLADIIKTKTEAYILDKANSFGAELAVEVKVDGSDLPVPCSVRISGSISPYGKKQLENVIANDLGIALEEQIWTG